MGVMDIFAARSGDGEAVGGGFSLTSLPKMLARFDEAMQAGQNAAASGVALQQETLKVLIEIRAILTRMEVRELANVGNSNAAEPAQSAAGEQPAAADAPA